MSDQTKNLVILIIFTIYFLMPMLWNRVVTGQNTLKRLLTQFN